MSKTNLNPSVIIYLQSLGGWTYVCEDGWDSCLMTDLGGQLYFFFPGVIM